MAFIFLGSANGVFVASLYLYKIHIYHLLVRHMERGHLPASSQQLAFAVSQA